MIQIRECTGEDFENVLHLLRQLWPDKQLDERKLRAVYDRALASDRHLYLCAVDGRSVVGFGTLSFKNSLWQEGTLARIDELVVDESRRAGGVGTLLLRQLTAKAADKGCSGIELDSSFHRIEAHGFYEKRGFAKRAFLFFKSIQ